ncbi:MAG: thioredoxin family protein [Acidobacteriota bacterium]
MIAKLPSLSLAPIPGAIWRHSVVVGLLLTALLVPLVSEAQLVREEKATIQLAEARTAFAPGETVRLAAVMTLEEKWHSNSHQPTLDFLIPTEARLEAPEGWGEPRFTYPEGVMLDFEFVEEPISVYEGSVPIWIEIDPPTGLNAIAAAADAATFRVAVRYQACDDSQCLPPVESFAETTVVIGDAGEPVNAEFFTAEALLPGGLHGGDSAASASTTATASSEQAPLEEGGRSLWSALLLAWVGGLILNAMPCVLPVLSLKVFGLMKSAGESRKAVARGTLVTALGILVSFWILAAVAVAARAAGQAAGWGVQFQEPGFVAFLAIVMVLFALNLWGLFEIPLPTALAMRLGGGGGQKEGIAAHFGYGLFATLMATPCSAPFLGTAVTFALAQPPLVIYAVFTAVALGMATPYIALAVAPGAAEKLPKPGPWMETLRGLLGFLLAGAALWLLFVLAGQISSGRLLAVEITLLAMAAFLWFGHRPERRSQAGGRSVARFGTLAMAVLALVLAIRPEAPERIDWQPFDRAKAETLAAAGTPVFIDVTADWCVTCKVNEAAILNTERVASAFERHGVVPMKADWTNQDENISRFLADHGRTGIPFYVLYKPGQAPHVFGEIISRDGILRQLEP